MVVVINVSPSIRTTFTGPEPVAVAPTVAVMLVLLFTVNVAAWPAISTEVTRLVPSPFRNPPAVIVTVVPVGPLSGAKEILLAVSAAPGNKVPVLGIPPVVNGFSTVSAAPGNNVPVFGVPPVVNGLDTVSAAPGNKVPMFGRPPVVNGLDTVSAAPGSSVPTLGYPLVVIGFSTVKPIVGSRTP